MINRHASDLPNLHKIYKITFKSGVFYIGRTRKTLKERLSAHIKRTNGYAPNPLLTYLLNTEEYTVDLVQSCHSEFHAKQAEFELIQAYYDASVTRYDIINMYCLGQKLHDSYGWNNKLAGVEEIRKKNRDYSRSRSDIRRNYHPNRDRLYNCCVCKQLVSGHNFPQSSSRTSGLASSCYDCRPEISRRARAKNKKRNEARPKSYWTEHVKQCYTCKKELPVTEFYSNMGYKDGFGSNCKVCTRKQKRANTQKNLLKWEMEQQLAEIKYKESRENGTLREAKRINDQKTCLKCQKVKPRSEYTKNKNRRDGKNNWCKTCTRYYYRTRSRKQKIKNQNGTQVHL